MALMERIRSRNLMDSLSKKIQIINLYKQYRSKRRVAKLLKCHLRVVRLVLSEAGVQENPDLNSPLYLPTPEEIERATRVIQSRWTDSQREEHKTYEGRVEWHVPVVTTPNTVKRRGRCPY
jgi:hypothetical protein